MKRSAPLAALLLLGLIGPAWGDDPPNAQPLDQQQRQVLERMERLEAQMLKLSKLLAETEPAKSERLRDALGRAGETRIRARMDEISRLLARSDWSAAERAQEALLADLAQLLTLLTDTSDDLDRKRAERQRLEALKRAVEALVQEQADHLQRSAELQAQAAEQAREAGEDSQSEAEQEKAARAIGGKPPREPGSHAERGKGSPGESQAGESKPGESKPGESKPGQSAQESESTPQQREAEQKLKNAIRRLEALQRESQKKAEHARDQAGGAEKSRPDSKKPGREELERAAEAMRQAADRLAEQQPQEAESEQREAAEALRDALEELEDALRQLRREEMEETLAALEVRFRAMLEREKTIRETTLRLYQKGMENWARRDLTDLTEAAQAQIAVALDCSGTLRLLTEEGTTVVLPELVTQLAADMRDVAERLEKSDASTPTQQLIDDVIDVLEEIIGAIERQRNEQQNQPQPDDQQQPQEDGPRPLLPSSAELKLLRSSQVRVNRRTAESAADVQSDAADAVAALQERLGKLAERQRQLALLARRMNERN